MTNTIIISVGLTVTWLLPVLGLNLALFHWAKTLISSHYFVLVWLVQTFKRRINKLQSFWYQQCNVLCAVFYSLQLTKPVYITKSILKVCNLTDLYHVLLITVSEIWKKTQVTWKTQTRALPSSSRILGPVLGDMQTLPSSKINNI